MTGTKGVIFDMDNTLLHSRIDFPAMKNEVYRFLVDRRILPEPFPVAEHTTSTLIEYAKSRGLSEELYEDVMQIAAQHELRGMEGAELERGVVPLLRALRPRCTLAVVTNNSFAAAVKALKETGIAGYFDLIVGREQMSSLKPSPSGFLLVLDTFREIAPWEWISVGDSWIDGKASADAGIPFVWYCSRGGEMHERGVHPIGRIDEIRQLIMWFGPQ